MQELAKIYDPKSVEEPIYQAWLDAKAFHADPAKGGKTYAIVIPPPNVTAALHLGHALNNTLQDILARWKRMAGFNTLWMPGTDHAGIATQTVVEKRILAEEGKRRTDFKGDKGRQEFIQRIQGWKDEFEARILGQLKAMGCSCDWDRTRFTMDEQCAKAVRAAFFKLFSDGLIYRGKRLVNWDPATQTVLADDEVEHETVNGHFYYLRYPLTEPVTIGGQKMDYITVATTRPETMLGDTAVAINPRDPRAAALRGKKVRLPIVGREIPIIEDEYVVLADPTSEDAKAKFATGFLKVTPAHDPNDYEIGRRHDLPVINVLAPDGSISDKHGWEDATTPEAQNLLGMDRFEARKAIVEWFRQEGLLEDVRDYVHEVGHSYRSHVPIEPYLSDQWFIDVRKPVPNCPLIIADCPLNDKGIPVVPGTDVPAASLAGMALLPLIQGKLHFVPDRYANNYRNWLENLRDWPISRQLWWGHRIPVWEITPGLPTPMKVFPRSSESPALFGAALQERLDNYAKVIGLPTQAFHVCVNEKRFKFFVCTAMPSADDALDKALQLRVEGSSITPGELRPATFGPTFDSGQAMIAASQVLQMIDKAERDPDVLDTWFSSGLWPISTMGWPEETELLKTFYPTSLLCTAREIITLWVSRMVMFGQYFRGDIPFADVYIHAMIQDGQGRKMSKSLGNGIDPLDIIASHGADAMRFTLAYMTTETQDVRMPVEAMTLPDGTKANSSPKFDVGRNYCNKLWNASRFAMMNLNGAPAFTDHSVSNLADAWILSRLNATVRDVTVALESYRFHEAADVLYRYMWNDFCDWYLEIAKIRINAGDIKPKAILAMALDVLLRLLHPIIPFITEAIWQQLNLVVPFRGAGEKPAEEMLVKAMWPRAQSNWINPPAEEQFGLLQQVISGIREVRNTHNVTPGMKRAVTIAASGVAAQTIQANADLICALAFVDNLVVQASVTPKASDANVMAGGMQALVHDVVDPAAEKARLQKRQETLAKGVGGAEAKLGNPNFLARAKSDVIEREKVRLVEMKEELAAVEKALAQLL